jgi:large subunit ribosomal protein L30
MAKQTKTPILKITMRRSPTGYTKRQKATVRALGIHRMHETVTQKDTEVIRGMIAKVSHLVEVEEGEE